MDPTNRWLLPKGGVEISSDTTTLYCLPQAGMGTAVYHSWCDKLAPEIQVLPIELPGHGSRMKEARITNLCQLSCLVVDALASSIKSGGPYALFGHSMGAWLAWEVLQEITQRQLPLPLRLYVSGNRPVLLSGAEHDLDATRLHKLPPGEFWEAFERRYGTNPYLATQSIRDFMYPMLKDDFTLVETYQPSTSGTVTTIPVTAIGARLDNRYTAQQIAAWQQHTTSVFQEVWLEGVGHNYIADAPNTLLSLIRSDLGGPKSAVYPIKPAAASTDGCCTCCTSQ